MLVNAVNKYVSSLFKYVKAKAVSVKLFWNTAVQLFCFLNPLVQYFTLSLL